MFPLFQMSISYFLPLKSPVSSLLLLTLADDLFFFNFTEKTEVIKIKLPTVHYYNLIRNERKFLILEILQLISATLNEFIYLSKNHQLLLTF